MKVAVITCYKQPDYVRAQTLRAAVAANGHTLFTVKNSRKGLLRYLEVFLKTLALRIRHRPDTYIITFRGYEILPFIGVITWPKRLIFDEFISPLGWLYEPRPEVWAKYVPKKALGWLYRILLRRPAVILADTQATAAYSSALTYGGGGSHNYVALPVSTDETLFTPVKKTAVKKTFSVFYYGNMLPLHGIQYVLDAAVMLQNLPIEFVIVGGKNMEAGVGAAVGQGARIRYHAWIDYNNLPEEIHAASLCLGGPFGATKQAELVITGKTYQFLACQAPVLIGKNKATSLFKHQKNCLMVPLGDSAALAKQISWAYSHQDKLQEIAANGRQLYEKHFSISAISPQLEAVLGV